MTEPSDSPASYISATASEISAKVRDGQWTASDVVAAHIQKHRADRSKNQCRRGPSFRPGPRSKAAEIDAARKRGNELGPLAGVPITIKECFHVAGTPSTLGLRHLASKLWPADAPLVTRAAKSRGNNPGQDQRAADDADARDGQSVVRPDE